MNPLGYFLGLLHRAPRPPDTVLLITGHRWRIERDGECVAEGRIELDKVVALENGRREALLVIPVADFCRILGLKRRGA